MFVSTSNESIDTNILSLRLSLCHEALIIAFMGQYVPTALCVKLGETLWRFLGRNVLYLGAWFNRLEAGRRTVVPTGD
jgi:hypothetical protein